MNFEVPALPYSKDALAPAMSEETLNYHYDKHHKGYMSKLKAALEGTPEAKKSLEDIVRSASGGNFNNAAQVWNHSFFWKSLRPGGGASASGVARPLLGSKITGSSISALTRSTFFGAGASIVEVWCRGRRFPRADSGSRPRRPCRGS